jgi:predicted nucleotidyltransferase
MVTTESLAARLAGRLVLDRARLVAFCRRRGVAEMALFGSVLRDDFRPDSDADVLVAFAPGARRGLSDLVEMEEELAGLVGRRVDLVTRRAVEESDNWTRRRSILDPAVPLPVVPPEARAGPGAADAPA